MTTRTEPTPQRDPMARLPVSTYEVPGASPKAPPVEFQIRDKGGNVLMVSAKYGSHAGAIISTADQRAVVSMIVRAVNSHAALVEALEPFANVNAYGQCRSCGCELEPVDFYCGCLPEPSAEYAWRIAARKALAAAKVKP